MQGHNDHEEEHHDHKVVGALCTLCVLCDHRDLAFYQSRGDLAIQVDHLITAHFAPHLLFH